MSLEFSPRIPHSTNHLYLQEMIQNGGLYSHLTSIKLVGSSNQQKI